jgi:FkbM family methyltransferase
MHNLSPGDVIGDYLAFTGIYELESSRRIIELGRAGGTLIDVGANMGYFSLLFAQAHPNNRVHAFEASPQIAARLRANVAAAGLTERIHIYDHAVAEHAGTLRFDPGPAQQSGWGGLSTVGSMDVVAKRLDACMDNQQHIRLLKIDIEGADTWALRSAAGLFEHGQVDEIWFEQHKPRMRSLDIGEHEAAEWLRARGYTLRPRSDPHDELVDWVATPSANTHN